MDDIEITRGDDETITLTITDPDNGDVPVDLTGCFLWFSVKRSIRDTPALIAKTVGAGIVVAAPATGVAVISLAPADTASLAPGPYPYDVQLKDSTGKVRTVASGTLSLAGDVTLVTS